MKLGALARRAGITASYLSELETTEGASPSAVVLYRIAGALEASIGELLDLPGQSVGSSAGQPVPTTLLRAKARYRLGDDEVELLKSIEYRGRHPRTEEDWLFLIQAIRRAVS